MEFYNTLFDLFTCIENCPNVTCPLTDEGVRILHNGSEQDGIPFRITSKQIQHQTNMLRVKKQHLENVFIKNVPPQEPR